MAPLASPRKYGYIHDHICGEMVMSTYSVADAKNALPSLIDRAASGEEVVITRHGKPVAEIRPLIAAPGRGVAHTYEWLRARRQARKPLAITSVELLDQLYAETKD